MLYVQSVLTSVSQPTNDDDDGGVVLARDLKRVARSVKRQHNHMQASISGKAVKFNAAHRSLALIVLTSTMKCRQNLE